MTSIMMSKKYKENSSDYQWNGGLGVKLKCMLNLLILNIWWEVNIIVNI
jgi:hypothetical protein